MSHKCAVDTSQIFVRKRHNVRLRLKFHKSVLTLNGICPTMRVCFDERYLRALQRESSKICSEKCDFGRKGS